LDLSVVLIIVVVAIIAIAVIGILIARRPPPATPSSVASTAPVTLPPSLRARLAKTRAALGGTLNELFRRDRIDPAFWDTLQEALIAADVGVGTSEEIVARVRALSPPDGAAARDRLEDCLVEELGGRNRLLSLVAAPAVVLVVGVNGTGKTTSIAKLAHMMTLDGRRVLLAAADTFRAAAEDQLRSWAERAGADIIGGDEGADPAAVAFDAYEEAVADGYDVLITDTAGRLHSKTNLMDELGKVARILRREAGDIDEVLLVLDGTTGQNALTQAHAFSDVVGLTGLIITKLDGTSKGGIAIAVEEELDVPVKFIGVGEGIDDLVPFDPKTFVDALLEP